MKWLQPDASYNALSDLPLEKYATVFKYIFLDADNTLQTHGQSSATPNALAFVRKVESFGMIPILYSNAKPHRAQALASSLGIELLAGARKPSGNALQAFLLNKGWDPKHALVVGDQLFTDLWAGKRAGVATIKVEPLSRDEAWWIKPKRILEDRWIKRWSRPKVFDDLML